jgi:Zn-dependent protease with chaperone function
MMHARRLFTYGLPLLLAACANMPTSLSLGKQESTAAPTATAGSPSLTALANTAVDIPEVLAVGVIPPPPAHTWADDKEDVNENRASDYGLVSIPVMEEYLNRLYKKAKQVADVPDWPGKVYVSSDTSMNAHSSAAGNIYLNIAVLQSAESEDEIFAVITHEFAHIYLNHQAAYRSKLMTGTAVFFGKAVVAVATKNAGSATWNAGDTLSVAGTLTDNVLIPNWQRSVEEQADRFGVTLSLKAGYSYTAGFKTFLERLASVERSNNAKAAAEKLAQEKKAKQTPGAPDWGASLTRTLGAASPDVKNHDDAEVREKTLTDEVRALPKGPRARTQSTPWKEITRNKPVAEVLAHFGLFSKIDELAQAHRLGEAVKVANMAASGATEVDGTAVIILFNLLHQENKLPLDAQIAVLLRNQNSPQRSWAAQVLAAKWMATTNPAQAKAFIEKQFEYFEKAPRTVPDMIGFYMESMKSPLLAASLNVPCMASNPRYRQACIDRSLTDAQRQANKAKQEARTDAMGKNIADKMGRALGLNK